MTEDQADYVNHGRLWRVGRTLGRTLYILTGDDPSKDDVVFGMVDQPELARHIVRLHNEWVERWRAECREFGCHQP